MWWATMLWVRRTPAAIALPGLIGLVLAAAWSRSGWQYEWDWAFSWTARTTALLGPVLAGLVAHDRARRHRPTLTTVERASIRGYLAAISVPLATFLIGIAAWLVAASVVSIRVSQHAPIGRPALSIFAEVAVVLLAACFLGAAIGAWFAGRAAGPVAALAVYALVLWGSDFRLRGVMSAGGSTGTMVGIERNPAWLSGFFAVHVAIIIACALAVAARRTPFLRTRLVSLAVGFAILGAGAGEFQTRASDAPYLLVATENTCVGVAPQVCGPVSFRVPLETAQRGLATAYRTLESSGLELPSRYEMQRGLHGKTFPPDSGVLTLDPGSFADGAYSSDDLLMTMATPTLCSAYFGELPPDDLLAAGRTVMSWIDERLRDEAVDPAPAQVASAYALLSGCAPYLDPLQ